jgi:predicted DNA-binding transcriptional regulator AlpA
MSDDSLLPRQETAEYLGLSTSTLERMRVNGTGPVFQKLGPGKRARVAYRRSDIEAWLQKQRFTSTAQYRRH